MDTRHDPSSPTGGVPEPGDSTTPPDAPPTVTEVGHYRRPLLGVPWIAAALLVPALMVGLSTIGKTPASTSLGAGGIPATAGASSSAGAAGNPTTSASAKTSASASNSAAPSSAPTPEAGAPILQITQEGSTVTLSGSAKDAATASSLTAIVQSGYGSGIKVVNKLTINPDAASVDAGAFGALAGSLKNVKGLILQAFGNQVTLIGVAPDAKSKKAVLSAAGTAYPDAEVTSSGLLVGDPSKAPTSCEVPQLRGHAHTANRIQFLRGTLLTVASASEVNSIAAALKKCPSLKVEVAGNTDSSGGSSTNQVLSLQRATVVKNRLVAQGVAATRITAVGNGETKPIASNDTDAGKLLNRRVDVTVK